LKDDFVARGVNDAYDQDGDQKTDKEHGYAVARPLYLIRMKSQRVGLGIAQAAHSHPDLFRRETQIFQPFPDPLGLRKFLPLLQVGGSLRRR